MTDKNKNLRLDEILIRDGLITESQLTEALQCQKLYGGKLGTQLLQHGFIDEATLVKVLSTKLSCDGVILSRLEIPEKALSFIPVTVAVARRVMPFAYDAEQNLLRVACEDPNNADLVSELHFVAAGKTVKLYLAAEHALNTAIARYYLGREANTEFGPSISFSEMNAGGAVPDGVSLSDDRQPKGLVLLVTDEATTGSQLQTMLERDRFKVIRSDSADDAIGLIGTHKFHTVFIQDTVPGDYIDLLDRIRKTSPKTRVRYYESAAALLLSLDAGAMEADLLVRNLELFTSLLSSTDTSADNHSARVGQYVDKLCRRMELADKDRLVITNAGYLHDLARFYYGNPETTVDSCTSVVLTIKLLNSLNYSPLVIEILRAMYINLREKFTKRLPIEVLGGNILTVVDIFCETIHAGVPLSLDKFDAIRQKYRDLVGKLFLTEVVEAFIGMIQEEILSITTLEKYSQVMLYARDAQQLEPVENRIKNGGFRTITESSFDAFVDLFKRSRPDIVILLECSGAEQVSRLVDDLNAAGIGIDHVPTFLLTDGALASQLSWLLEKGIEDVIPIEDNLNVLLIKMKKIQARIENKAREREELIRQSGAVGHLDDMNLIDLLQALGPSRKTVKLTLTSGRQEVVIYLNQGEIFHASGAEKSGPEAVYEAIAWSTGTWNIQPAPAEGMPEQNSFYPNESILMEGCRLLDERTKSTPSQASTPA